MKNSSPDGKKKNQLTFFLGSFSNCFFFYSSAKNDCVAFGWFHVHALVGVGWQTEEIHENNWIINESVYEFIDIFVNRTMKKSSIMPATMEKDILINFNLVTHSDFGVKEPKTKSHPSRVVSAVTFRRYNRFLIICLIYQLIFNCGQMKGAKVIIWKRY